jgi:hypothetical protein
MDAFRGRRKMDFQANHKLIGLVAYPRDQMPCLMRLQNLRESFRAILLKQQIDFSIRAAGTPESEFFPECPRACVSVSWKRWLAPSHP